MPLSAFYKKYIALDCWVPFAGEEDNHLGWISWFVQTSDSTNFCEPAPRHESADFMYPYYIAAYSPDVCVNGSAIYNPQECWLTLGAPDLGFWGDGANNLAIAAGCASVPVFT